MRGLDHVPERVAVLGDVDDERVDVYHVLPDANASTATAAVLAEPSGPAPHDESFCSLLLGGPRAGAVDDLHEHGDAVALGDRLAQPPRARHGP